MAGRHSAKGENIFIIKTVVQQPGSVVRDKTRQFNKKDLKYPSSRPRREHQLFPTEASSLPRDQLSSEQTGALLMKVNMKSISNSFGHHNYYPGTVWMLRVTWFAQETM